MGDPIIALLTVVVVHTCVQGLDGRWDCYEWNGTVMPNPPSAQNELAVNVMPHELLGEPTHFANRHPRLVPLGSRKVTLDSGRIASAWTIVLPKPKALPPQSWPANGAI